ncbi:MAG: hypothetical protein R3Y12_04145 [Clostridia bacterium]
MNIRDKILKSGFEFTYFKGRLSNSKLIYDFENIEMNKRNTDDIPLFVKCKECDEYMDFEIGILDSLDGKWICPFCQSNVSEEKIYSKLNYENETNHLLFEDDTIPRGCGDCGGPWPNCISSCKIYND